MPITSLSSELVCMALPDRFFLLSLGRRKKGLVNSLYQFCSANPHFLGVNNWPLMASDKRQRAEYIRSSRRVIYPIYGSLSLVRSHKRPIINPQKVEISVQNKTDIGCQSDPSSSPTQRQKEKKRSSNARLSSSGYSLNL